MRTREEIAADAVPFNPSVIREVDAGGGRKADYVSWPHYAQRLLLAHGPHRYTVTGVHFGRKHIGRKADRAKPDVVTEEYVWAVSVRVQFGEDEWYDAVGEGDNPTAAESNAYKRACAHAGIGLHLYGDYWLHGQLTKDDQPEGEGAGV